jgi:hypothetical protein
MTKKVCHWNGNQSSNVQRRCKEHGIVSNGEYEGKGTNAKLPLLALRPYVLELLHRRPKEALKRET